MEGEVTAVVLAATEQGGMGDEYFENKTRHLVPLNEKPLIFHLIDTLISDSRIKKVYVIIEERIDNFKKILPCGITYNEIINRYPIYGNRICLHGQNFLTRVGTYEAVKSFVNYHMDEFPLLIIYGDSHINKNFLDIMISRFLRESNYRSSSVIYWGLVPPFKEKGNILLKQDAAITDAILEENILEIADRGIYTSSSLKDTGMMMISKDAWKNIYFLAKMIHRPSQLGIFSFPSIFRQSLIFKNKKILGHESMDINIKCILGHENDYADANFPWELLEIGAIIRRDKISEIMKFDPDAKLIRDEIDLIKYLGQNPIFVQDRIIIRIDDKNILFIGPCYIDRTVKIANNAIIDGSYVGLNSIIESNSYIYHSKLENVSIGRGASIERGIIKNSQIKENSIIKDSFIGDNCFVSNNVVISDSTLERTVKIHTNSIIENAIIMEDTTIFQNCLVVRSIIGKSVMLGVGVNMPCKRLNKINENEFSDKNVTYFSDIDIRKTEKFGAIIGDYCQIGSSAIIHPGRRIGKKSKINSGHQVVKNLPPHSETSPPWVRL